MNSVQLIARELTGTFETTDANEAVASREENDSKEDVTCGVRDSRIQAANNSR